MRGNNLWSLERVATAKRWDPEARDLLLNLSSSYGSRRARERWPNLNSCARAHFVRANLSDHDLHPPVSTPGASFDPSVVSPYRGRDVRTKRLGMHRKRQVRIEAHDYTIDLRQVSVRDDDRCRGSRLR